MDRGAWWVQSMGSRRLGHNWATNTDFSFTPQDVVLGLLVVAAGSGSCPPWPFYLLTAKRPQSSGPLLSPLTGRISALGGLGPRMAPEALLSPMPSLPASRQTQGGKTQEGSRCPTPSPRYSHLLSSPADIGWATGIPVGPLVQPGLEPC